MDMKNVGNVPPASAKPNYLQVDNDIKLLSGMKGVEVLSSRDAYEKYDWVRKIISKPEYGYFIWVKEQINTPLFSCVLIENRKITQNLKNLLVVENGIKVDLNATCSSVKSSLEGSHNAKGNIILKPGAEVNYNHNHKWSMTDSVNINYNFLLMESSRLNYYYKNLYPPSDLNIKNEITTEKKSKVDLKIIIDGRDTKANISDVLNLNGRDSSGIVKIRIVGRENSDINAQSKISAVEAVKGHLDCQGLLLSNKSEIKLVPELFSKNKNSMLTHEASIGKISQDVLEYLESRGLAEKQAIDLIVNGFLR